MLNNKVIVSWEQSLIVAFQIKDSESLGKRIRLKLVKISLEMGEEGDFGIPSTQTTMEANATAYLDSFCGYVNSLQVIRYLDYLHFELRIYFNIAYI